jgi:hypothetical protein
MTQAEVQFGRDLVGRGTVEYSGNLVLLRQAGYGRTILLWLLPAALIGAVILAVMAISLIVFFIFALLSGGAVGVLLAFLYQHFWLRRETQIAVSPMHFVMIDRFGGTVMLRRCHVPLSRWLWFDVRRVADLAITFGDAVRADEFIAAFEDQRKSHLLSPALAQPMLRPLPPLPEKATPSDPA